MDNKNRQTIRFINELNNLLDKWDKYAEVRGDDDWMGVPDCQRDLFQILEKYKMLRGKWMKKIKLKYGR